MTLLIALLGLLALVISLTVHEFMHAYSAHLLGDDTAIRAGRMTLNPVPHIDPIGTLVLPLVAALTSLPLFGWAKPVPVNPYNLRYGKWGQVIVALAGPISNFVIAFIFVLLLRVVLSSVGVDNFLVLFLSLLVIVNVSLGLFNFLPFPPLDGANLALALLDSPKYQNARLFLQNNGPMLLLGLIMIDYISPVPLLSGLFGGAISWVFRIGGIDQLGGFF